MTSTIAFAVPFKDRHEHILENISIILPQSVRNPSCKFYFLDNSDSDQSFQSISDLFDLPQNCFLIRTGGLSMAENWSKALEILTNSNCQYSVILEDKTCLRYGALERLLKYIEIHGFPDYMCWNSSIEGKDTGLSSHIPINRIFLSQGGSCSLRPDTKYRNISVIQDVISSVLAQGFMSRYLRALPRDCSLIKTTLLPKLIPANVFNPDYYIGLHVLMRARSFTVLSDSITSVIYTATLKHGNGGNTARKKFALTVWSADTKFFNDLISAYRLFFPSSSSRDFDTKNFLINILIAHDFRVLLGNNCIAKVSAKTIYVGLLKEILYRYRLGANMNNELLFVLRHYPLHHLLTSLAEVLCSPRDARWITMNFFKYLCKRLISLGKKA